MFREEMSGNELIEEYRMDLPELQIKTLHFNQSDYVTNYLWKRRKQPVVAITRNFTTSQGNKYMGILIYVQIGTRKQKKWDWSSFHVRLMSTPKGECAIAFYTESGQAIKFTPHFFERYKERFSNACGWKEKRELASAKTMTDIIAAYMKRNLSITWIETKSVFRDKVHIFAPVNDGIALLQWSKNRKLLQANTFITMDMLDDRQMEMVRYAKTYLSLSKEDRNKFKCPDFIYEE